MENRRNGNADPAAGPGRAKRGNGNGSETVMRPFYVAGADGEAPVHIWVGPKALIVTADVQCPDLLEADVSVEGSKLILKGSCRPDGGEPTAVRTVLQEVDLPYRVDAGSVEISFDKGFMYIVLQREEERTYDEKPLLEAAIINSVKRYFADGEASQARDARADRFLMEVLQRYFRQRPKAAGAG